MKPINLHFINEGLLEYIDYIVQEEAKNMQIPLEYLKVDNKYRYVSEVQDTTYTQVSSKINHN